MEGRKLIQVMTSIAPKLTGLSKDTKLRSMIVAPKDHVLIQWDLNQAESWCVAYFANEKTMQTLLKENRFHEHTAAAIAGCTEEVARLNKDIRYGGKQANHSLAYRMSYLRYIQQVAKNTDGKVILSPREGKRHVDIWHGLYKIEGWWAQLEYDLQAQNRTLTNPYGRPRTYFTQWGKELFKEATAGLPQGTVADHTNGAIQPELGIEGGLLEIHRQLVVTGLCRLINQSHDSGLAEVHKDKAEEVMARGKKLMERPLVINGEQFTIPVSVEIGERWGELKEVKV